MSVGTYNLGGSKGRGGAQGPFLLKMQWTRAQIKSNDWYHTPHNGASWARSMNRGILRARQRRV